MTGKYKVTIGVRLCESHRFANEERVALGNSLVAGQAAAGHRRHRPALHSRNEAPPEQAVANRASGGRCRPRNSPLTP